MKKARFTESQIVASIKKNGSGISARDISRELGISEATFYNWKAKYGGLEVSDVKRTFTGCVTGATCGITKAQARIQEQEPEHTPQAEKTPAGENKTIINIHNVTQPDVEY